MTAVKSAVAEALGVVVNTNTAAIANVTEASTPAEIKFYKNEEIVKTVDVDADELEALGSLEIQDVVLDPKYEDDWNEFTVVVVDADNNELYNTVAVVDDTFTITLADERVITVSFSFEAEENEVEKKADEVVTDDTAQDTTSDATEDTTGENSDQTVSEEEVTEEEKAETDSKPEEEAEDSAEPNNGSEEAESESGEADGESGETQEDSETKDQEGATASDDKEDAATVPEVGETTQETEVEETDTLTKNE